MHPGEYTTIAKNIAILKAINELPLALDLKRLDEGNEIKK